MMLIKSLDKPWNSPSPVLPTRDAPASYSSLYLELSDAVRTTTPRQDAHDWEAVNKWWWVAYAHLLSTLHRMGDNTVRETVSKFVQT